RPDMTLQVKGAQAVAERAMTYRRLVETPTRVLVNGMPGGIVWAPDGSPFAVVALTVRGKRLAALDFLVDPVGIGQLDLTVVPRSGFDAFGRLSRRRTLVGLPVYTPNESRQRRYE